MKSFRNRLKDVNFWVVYLVVFGVTALLAQLNPVTRDVEFQVRSFNGWITLIPLLLASFVVFGYVGGFLTGLLGRPVDPNGLVGQILKGMRQFAPIPLAIALGTWLAPAWITCNSLVGITWIWLMVGAACGLCDYIDKSGK